MKYTIIFFFIINTLYSSDITGIWHLSNGKHPINFCGNITYKMTIRFNRDNTLTILNKTTNSTKIKIHFKVA